MCMSEELMWRSPDLRKKNENKESYMPLRIVDSQVKQEILQNGEK